MGQHRISGVPSPAAKLNKHWPLVQLSDPTQAYEMGIYLGLTETQWFWFTITWQKTWGVSQ